MNVITENDLLYCRYITSDTTAFPFFTCVSARVDLCTSVMVMGVGRIFKFVENLQINCEDEENRCHVLCV
jgi:hypothetical protein